MKRYFLLGLAALGLIALAPTESKADDGFRVYVSPGYQEYRHYYYGDDRYRYYRQADENAARYRSKLRTRNSQAVQIEARYVTKQVTNLSPMTIAIFSMAI